MEILHKNENILHQGYVAEIEKLEDLSLKEFIKIKKNKTLLCLQGVTDPRNIGSIIRSALAFKIDGIIVKGNIFLNPEEAAEFNANFQGMDRLSKEAGDWLRDNVDSAGSQLDADDAVNAANDAAHQARYDALSPEEKAKWDAEQAEFDETF